MHFRSYQPGAALLAGWAATLTPITVMAGDASLPNAAVACIDGKADDYSCSRITLAGHLSASELGLGGLSDIWGWTDPDTGSEYVIIGHFNGTSFVDISTPTAPRIKGFLPAHEDLVATASKICAPAALTLKNSGRDPGHGNAHDEQGGCDHDEGSNWRDIKVYANHAFVVSESANHGMQVFDLTRLRSELDNVEFDEDARYGSFGSAHNLVINEDTGFAYAVGTSAFNGGLLFVDIRNPVAPTGAGGYDGDGYTHDAQCVIYQGADTTYQGREICFASNEDTVTLVDVTQKAFPMLISRRGYSDASYIHQGWLSPDHNYFYQNDETDERNLGIRTRTQIWDMHDLDNPQLLKSYLGVTRSIDHNNYTLGDYLFQSNYTSGLRVLNVQDPANPIEVPYFDSYVFNDAVNFDGSWSNYPYFPSGTVALSDRSEGLFLLQMDFIDTRLPASDIRLDVTDAVETQSSAAGRLAYQYTAIIGNDGFETAEDLQVTHILSGGATLNGVTGPAICAQRDAFLDCAFGTLLAGETKTLVLDIDIPEASSIQIEVRGSALNPDPDFSNNQSQQSIALSFTPPASNAAGGGGGSGSAGFWSFVMLILALNRRRTGKVG